MAVSPIEMNTRLQIRSLSLPSKTHPINKRIEEELKKLRTKEETSSSPAETIIIGLSGLADLYTCINEVLSLPLTQQALSLRQHEKRVSELLKGCSNLHNVSSTMRVIVLQQQKLASNMSSALLKQNEGPSYYESEVANYFSSRKEVIKRAKGIILLVKQLVHDDSFESSKLFQEDHRLSTVIKALTCVSIINISVCESLVSFLSIPVSKPMSGSLVSKLIHKSRGKSIYQVKTGNDLMDVDVTLHSLSSGANADKVKIAQKRLEELVGVMEGIRNSLDSAYVQLTETKACLLNIISF